MRMERVDNFPGETAGAAEIVTWAANKYGGRKEGFKEPANFECNARKDPCSTGHGYRHGDRGGA